MPAFLAAFEGDVAADTRLAAELERAPRDSTDAKGFLNDVFISVQSYLNTERGALGQTIRNRAAQHELQQFLQTNVAALPEDVRLTALTGVRDASRTIGDGGLTMFTAVDANRRNLTSTFDFDAGVLRDRLGVLESTAVTAQQVDNLFSQILEQARADVTAGILDATAPLELQIQQLANSQVQLSQQVALKADRSAVDAVATSNAALARQLDTLSASTTGLRTDVNGLSTSVSTLNTKVSTDLKAVDTRLNGIDARLPRR